MYLVEKLTNIFSRELDTKIEIESVDYELFNKMAIKGVYIEDQSGDSLLTSQKATGHLDLLDLRNRKLFFRKLELENAKIHIRNDTSKNINIQFLVEAFKRKDTTKSRMHTKFGDIRVNNSHLSYTTNRPAKKDYGLDFNRLRLDSFNVHVKDFDADAGKVNFNLAEISFRDKSGFKLLDMDTEMFIHPEEGGLRNTVVRTPYSFISADSVILDHGGYEYFADFISKVRLNVSIKRSNLAFQDLAYFAEPFHGMPDQNFVFSGTVKGRVNSLRGSDIYAAMGKHTEIQTSFNSDGLPDISETYLYVDIESFRTGLDDLELVNSLMPESKTISMPENLDNIGLIRYSGNFTGFYDDFVAYGNLETEMGELSTDISIKPQKDKRITINGNLKTNNFDLGELVNNTESYGNLSMDVQVKGSGVRNQGFTANTDGIIKKLEINGYNYQNIELHGLLTERKYDGALTIEDPNINLNFSGGIDFSEKVPVFDFNAEIKEAKLNALNFVEDDTTALLSANLVSNLKGNSIDNASGEIHLTEGVLIKDNKKLNLDDFKIDASHIADTQKIFLNSDYVDGSLVGKYQSSSVYQSMKNLFYSYLPVFIKNTDDTSNVKVKNNFRLNIDLKNINPLTNLFLPDIEMARNSEIEMEYDGSKKSFFLEAKTDTLQYANYLLDQFHLTSASQDTLFSLITTFDKLGFKNDEELAYFDNFKLKSVTGGNTSKLMVDWKDPETYQMKGEMLALINFNRSPDSQNIYSKVHILPGKVRLKDEVWKLKRSSISIDSSTIQFNDLRFHHDKQRMVIDGVISKNPDEQLNMDLKEIDLKYTNIFLPGGKIDLNGLAKGHAEVRDLYGNPVFQSNLTVDTLKFNGQTIGGTNISSKWDSKSEDVSIDLESKRGNLKTLDAKGVYTPEKQELGFDIAMDKLRMDLLNPVLEENFSDIKGVLSGDLTLNGTTKAPMLNGKVTLQKSALTVDYLQTRYYITHQLDVLDNKLIFNQASVYDDKGNMAVLDGEIDFQNFKDLSYDLNIDAEEFQALNTSSIHNSIYYGDGYVSGLVDIQGNTTNNLLGIDASVSTNDNTIINLPINSSKEQEKTKFVTFTSEKGAEVSDETEDYSVDLSNLDMNFDLEITPEAETRLIFNPELGDMIKANGRGNLNMEVNQSGNFRIFGEYVIEEGDYMLTLKNVINKNFEIQQGSRIVWNGDPEDADINVTAVYNLRTSLDNLFLDTTSNYQKRIPVECKINLKEKLNSPDISFEIDLPTADESTIARLNSVLTSEEEMNKQFLSLLVLNTFMPAEQYLAGQTDPNELGASGMAFTTSELLSNQLSHWLSQISNNWDIGVNYQPGDDISRDQVEVALSTQLLNDRLIINGNVASGGRYAQASEIVGDVRIDWKLTESGKLRLKFFNRNSDRLLYEETRYIQGAGLYYREDFNSFGELFRDITKKKKSKETN
ncbi:MAG: translocation/assembly module TamB domain-containing protein [Bacteroidota bacterium]